MGTRWSVRPGWGAGWRGPPAWYIFAPRAGAAGRRCRPRAPLSGASMPRPSSRLDRLAAVRIVAAVAAAAAILLQAVHAARMGRFSLATFLSFFTIQSNLIALGVLLVEARGGLGIAPERRGALRGAATVYVLVAGIVYAALLADLPAARAMAHPVANPLLHVAVPAWMALDWLACPPQAVIRYGRTLLWLVYPYLYLFASLLRGRLTGWYPYPFLDPRSPGGWVGLAAVCAGITALACALAALLLVAANWRRRGTTAPLSDG